MESDQFKVFNQLYVANGPSVVTGHGSSWQKIRAGRRSPLVDTRPSPPQDLIQCLCGMKDINRGIFLGSMVCTQPHRHDKGVLTSISAVRIAQVCVIFKLPKHVGLYPHPLVYIKWFTLLHHHDPVSGQFVVTRSTHNHQRNMSVISADRFTHPCHLQPSVEGTTVWIGCLTMCLK